MTFKVICKRRDIHEYDIEERYIAGISLTGSEVKSIRQGKISIDDAIVTFQKHSPFLINMYVAHYQNSPYNTDPRRSRALLLKKREIERIYGLTTRRGYKVIPLAILIKDNKLVKVEIGVVKKKKIWNKKKEIIKREMERRDREMKF